MAVGEREPSCLGKDIWQAMRRNEVLEVLLRGFHCPSGVWFIEDCALSDPELMSNKGLAQIGLARYEGAITTLTTALSLVCRPTSQVV